MTRHRTSVRTGYGTCLQALLAVENMGFFELRTDDLTYGLPTLSFNLGTV